MNDYNNIVERWFMLSALGFALVGGMLFAGGMGCKTTDSPPAEQTNSVLKTAAIVEMSAQLATFAAVRENPHTEPYFRASITVLSSALTRGDYNPTNIAALLRSVGGNDELTFLAVTSALNVYKIVWADAVGAHLDENIYVRPVLLALQRGISLGLDGPKTARKFNLPRK